MFTREVVPKRHIRAWLLASGALLLALAVAGYVSWTHLSARMALRWFVREAGIPVDVRAASWDAHIQEVLDGKIRALHLELVYKPLDLTVNFDSPVVYQRHGSHWSIRLEPVLEIGDLPAIQGTLALEFDVLHEGDTSAPRNVAAEFHVREVKPLELENASGKIKVKAWNIDGWVSWASRWSSHVDVSLKDANASGVGAKSVKIGADVSWPSNPPFPLDVKATVEAAELSFLRQSLFITEPVATATADFHFDGRRFEPVDISVDKPVRIRTHGSYAEGALNTNFSLTGSLDALFTQRAAQWLEAEAPLLRRAKADGTLALSGKLALKPGQGLSANARVKLDADRVELPLRNLAATGLSVDAPLVFPGDPDWGTVHIKTVDFGSVRLHDLALEARVGINGVDLTTEGTDGDDRPIRQSVWGGSIDIADLYAHVGGKEGTEFTASVEGGPFQIPAIQSDLCLAPDHPIAGQLSFTYPEIVLDRESISLIGDINVDAFNGKAHVGDLRLDFGARAPRLRLNVEWSDIDLQAIGRWTNIGDIRGSLFGALDKADFELTPNGVFPNSYELTLRGSQRGGNKLSFYGRALKNVMAMLGASLDTLPPTAAFWLNLTMLYRNLLPAHADVMGFQAVANQDWTELTTFDIPEGADSSCNPKMHYILCGTGFTIPLNTHGVYPLMMRTLSFHDWLNQRAKYIQGLMKAKNTQGQTKNADTSKCTPLF